MKHALVVDDHPHNLYLLRALLRGHGWTVDEAAHGGEALALARQRLPTLVIADLLMPVMDGFTLLRHWKSDAALRAVPFIVYTATYTEPKDERLALALGADAFLIKPAEPDVLLEAIDEVLARAGHEATSTPAPRPADDPSLLADYNEVLVRKLEKRALQLEAGNHELRARLDELERTKAALQESEERFRATFEQAAVGIAHVGVDGGFLRVNDKLCEMTGFTRDDLLQTRLGALTDTQDRAASEAAWSEMLAGRRPSDAREMRCRHRVGHGLWVHVVSTLLRATDGEPRYFISVFSDVTERRELQEQVRQAQKLESVGQLTGGIAHDFNNLLTVIIGNTELLIERLAGDPALSPLADMALAAAARGAELTQHLLAFSRRQALDPRAIDVNQLLLGMDRMLRRMLPEDIEVRFVPGPDLRPALVDPAQLEASVLNLGINARDAMPAGGQLTIETHNLRIDEDDAALEIDLAAGDYVQVAVSDSGQGIAADDLARVFEPFFTTKPVGKGTGLGLSMVYGFVKQSRGHVKLYSEPGIGTTVKLCLPCATELEAAVPAPAEPGLNDLQGHETLLLVEDDELVRRFAEQQLATLGYRVLAAADGAAALSLLQARDDIALLFTDVVMPGGMNGRQLADAAVLARPGLKVLFSSGYSDNALVHHGRLDRGVHLLSKPYSRLDLSRKVRAVLDAGGAGPPPPGRLLILDDDPMVGSILALSAESFGFQTQLTSRPQEFFEQQTRWQPSHVAIDLTMPEMAGLQVLDRLAQDRCRARVIVCSGADGEQMNAALTRARALGLAVAGKLNKPLSVPALRQLLQGDFDAVSVAAD